MTPSEVKALLAQYGITPTKSKGQSFLLDEALADREVSYLGIEPGDVVLEVGPGLGVLTERVLALASRTVCVELDPGLASFIQQRFEGQVELIQGDALQVELPDFNKFISNIPYSISSPLIFRILEEDFRRAVIMVQKEFADRMAAEPGSDDYSRLTVSTYYRARCELLEQVPRSKFWPQPEVDSTVVLLEPRPPPFKVESERFYLHLVNVLFQHRRKKIGTILKMTGQVQKERMPSLPFLERRVEELSPEQIGEISDAIGLSRKNLDR